MDINLNLLAARRRAAGRWILKSINQTICLTQPEYAAMYLNPNENRPPSSKFEWTVAVTTRSLRPGSSGPGTDWRGLICRHDPLTVKKCYYFILVLLQCLESLGVIDS